MRRKIVCRILPALSLVMGILLAGCSSYIQGPDIPGGLLQIHLAAKGARTLTPDLVLGRYDLTLSAEGQETIVRSIVPPETLTVKLELAPLVWTVTAQGFAQADDKTPIAQGILEVKIKPGSTETITLPLGPLGGAGTLHYTISLPEGLSSASLTLSPLADGASPIIRKLLEEGGDGAIPNLAAGYYRLNLSLEREATPLAGQGASLSEVVHIYDGAETVFALSAEAAAAVAWAYVPKPWLSFDPGRRVTDADAPKTQEEWEVQNTFYVASGSSVVLAPLAGNMPQGAVYEWTIDNAPVHTGESLTKSFTAPSSSVTVSATVDGITHATASALVKTASAGPRQGGSKAQAATCIEFSPAPGQFVGNGNGYSNPEIPDLASLTEENVRALIQS
jgi:hypothetical protein